MRVCWWLVVSVYSFRFCCPSRVCFHIWSNQMDHSSKSNMTYVSLFLPIHLPLFFFFLSVHSPIVWYNFRLNWRECGRWTPENNGQKRTYVDRFDVRYPHRKWFIDWINSSFSLPCSRNRNHQQTITNRKPKEKK